PGGNGARLWGAASGAQRGLAGRGEPPDVHADDPHNQRESPQFPRGNGRKPPRGVTTGTWTSLTRCANAAPAVVSASSISLCGQARPSGTSASSRPAGPPPAGTSWYAWPSRSNSRCASATSGRWRPAPGPAYRETALDDPALAPVRTAIDHILKGHLPYPALGVDRNGEVIAANEALDLITEGADPGLAGPGTNAYRLALHPDGMAPRILNFADWARHILERIGHLPELRAELAQYVPELEPPAGHLGFAVPLHLP